MLQQDESGKTFLVLLNRFNRFERFPVEMPRKPMTFVLSHTWTIDEAGQSTVVPCLFGCSVCERRKA